MFTARGEQDFLTDEGGGGGGGLLNFFSPLIKKASIILWMFLLKEGHLNNSMLEDSLLAYLLYKYTLYSTFIINIKVKCFYYKANIAFKSTRLQVQNFNEKFNLSLNGKLPIFLCQLAVATEIKTNKWTETELYKLT